jgi:taurine dioxygenase
MVQSIVRIHPETGRRLLYLSDRIRHFVGMSEEESKPLFEFLYRHASSYEFTYRHRWTLDDLLMWDNRCAMHRAALDHDQRQLRRLQRCSLLGPKTGYVYTGDGDPASTATIAHERPAGIVAPR